MRFKIPDFPLGVLFAAMMAWIAILFASPELAGEWLWWALVFAAFILWSLGAGILDKAPLFPDGKPQRSEDREPGQQDEDQPRISADAAALVDAITGQERTNRAQEKGEDDARRRRELITILIIAITAVAIILQVNEMKRVYGPIRDQAGAALVANRAWIAPRYVSFYGPITAGNPITVRTKFDNPGRIPALDVEFHTLFLSFGSHGQQPISVDAYRNKKFGANTSCESPVTNYMGVEYPASPQFIDYSDSLFNQFRDNTIASFITNGTDILVLQGCFRYRTLDEWRWSKFCEYLEPVPGESIETWQFKYCADGNDAN